VLLVPALLCLAVVIVAYPPGATEQAFERFLDSLPGWLDPMWEFLANALWLWAGC
jgi:hypothetical protein